MYKSKNPNYNKYLSIKYYALIIFAILYASFAFPATRSVNIDNCKITISINTDLTNEQGSYAIIENLQNGIIPRNISEEGLFDQETSTIYWGAYLDKENRNFSYEITGNLGQYDISGVISVDGGLEDINGDSSIQIQYCPLNFITTQEDILPGQADVSYSLEMIMEGGERPFSFEIIYGSLPPGLTIDTVTGKISGKPEKAGFYNFYLVANDARNFGAEREFSIEVTEKFEIETKSIISGTKGMYFYYIILAVGGREPYKFSKIEGDFPPGISLSDDGVLSGVCESTGEYEYIIKSQDIYGNEFSKTFSQSVYNPLKFESQRLANGIVGDDYYMDIDSSGGMGKYHFNVYSGMLPQGLLIDSQTGIISGKSQEEYYGTIVFSVTDDDGRKIFKDLTMQISKPLKFSSQDLPAALKNEKYSEIIRIEGGIGPFTYNYTGSMPSDLSFNEEYGLINGVSTIAGLNNLYIIVKDSSWPEPQQIEQFLKLRTTSFLTILTSSVLPRARRGKEINNIFLEAGGGPSPYKWEISEGSLPPGIRLDSDIGKIWGTSASKGPVKFTLKVTDTNNNTASKEFIWHITDILNIETGILPEAAEGHMYNFSLKASGGITPYKWRLKNTNLPEGLSINLDTGTIYGTPKIQTSQSIIIEVSDSDNSPQIDEKEFHFEVIPDSLYIYTPELPSCQVNSAYTAELKALFGKPPYSWRLKQGALPDGFSLKDSSSLAAIEGTPIKSGYYTFTIEVGDSSLPQISDQKTYTIEIYGDMVISNTALNQAVKGKQYYDRILVHYGLAPYSFSIINGKLPDNLILDAISGEITGMVSSNIYDSTEFVIQVQDSRQPPDVKEKTFVIYVSEPLEIITQKLPDSLQYHRYIKTIEVNGGIKRYRFSLYDGSLPEGLNLDANSGAVFGFPKDSGKFVFSIKVSDSSIDVSELIQKFELNVIESEALPVVSGDLDADLKIDLKDAVLILKIVSNMHSIPVLLDADINKDNKINLIDAVMIFYLISEVKN